MGAVSNFCYSLFLFKDEYFMNYIAITITSLENKQEEREILIALLDSIDFEGITEIDDGLIAYIPKEKYNVDLLYFTIESVFKKDEFSEIRVEEVEEKNWNEIWESNFEPVLIDNRCVIRAPFHKDFTGTEFVITIEPKMAFGTGHHETTGMMISEMLNMNLSGKNVLDMGCGTGILGILAYLMKAQKVVCIDNDQWSVSNTLENAEKNNAILKVIHGSKEQIPNIKFDIILANINRNILLVQLSEYVLHLNNSGILLISGILKQDKQILVSEAIKSNLQFAEERSKGNWSALKFIKI